MTSVQTQRDTRYTDRGQVFLSLSFSFNVNKFFPKGCVSVTLIAGLCTGFCLLFGVCLSVVFPGPRTRYLENKGSGDTAENRTDKGTSIVTIRRFLTTVKLLQK